MKNFIILLTLVLTLNTVYSKADFQGKWEDKGDYQEFNKPLKINNGLNEVLYYKEDVKNRQFLIIDSNRILYRINIDDGSTSSSFKIPKLIDLSKIEFCDIGANDSIMLIVTRNDKLYAPDTVRYSIYNLKSESLIYTDYWYRYLEDEQYHSISNFRNSFNEDKNNLLFSYSESTSDPAYGGSSSYVFSFVFDYEQDSVVKSVAFGSCLKSIKNDRLYYNSSFHSYGSTHGPDPITFIYNCQLFDANDSLLRYFGYGGDIYLDVNRDYPSINYRNESYRCFTNDANYLVAIKDSTLMLFSKTDPKNDIKIHCSGIIDIAPINDESGANLMIFKKVDLPGFPTRILKFNYLTKQYTDSINVSLNINNLVPIIVDSNTIIFSNDKLYKIDFNKTKNYLKSDFIVSDTLLTTEVESSFIPLNCGNYKSLLWDFGDGQYSEEIVPSHKYTFAGIYSVKLQINRENIIDTLFKNNLIRVVKGTKININYTVDTLHIPYTITFVNTDSDSVIIDCYLGSEDKFILKNNTPSKIDVSHSGIYNLRLYYFDVINKERKENIKISIILPKSDRLEWEKYYDSNINPDFSAFINNNRFIINGTKNIDDYTNNQLIMKINSNGELEQNIINPLVNVVSLHTEKVSENCFLNLNTNVLDTLSFVSDSNFNYLNKIELYPDYQSYRINQDSFYIFQSYKKELGLYKYSLSNTMQNEYKFINNYEYGYKITTMYKYPKYLDAIVSFYFYWSNYNEPRIYMIKYDSGFNEKTSIMMEYTNGSGPITYLTENKFILFNRSSFKLMNIDSPVYDSFAIPNYYIEKILKNDINLLIISGTNITKKCTELIIADTLGIIIDSLDLKDNYSNITNIFYNETDNSLTLVGRDPETQNFYIAKTKSLDGVLSVKDEKIFDKSQGIIYPNPVTKSFIINEIYEAPMEITISDMSGKIYDYSNLYTNSSKGSIEINVEGLSAGVYILNLKLIDGKITTYKFVKE